MLNRREYLLAPIKNQISHPMVLRVETLWGIQNNTSHLAFFIQLYALGMHTFSDKSVIGFAPTPPPFPHGRGNWLWKTPVVGDFKFGVLQAFLCFSDFKSLHFYSILRKKYNILRLWRGLANPSPYCETGCQNTQSPSRILWFFWEEGLQKKPGPIFTKLALPGVQTLGKYME